MIAGVGGYDTRTGRHKHTSHTKGEAQGSGVEVKAWWEMLSKLVDSKLLLTRNSAVEGLGLRGKAESSGGVKVLLLHMHSLHIHGILLRQT